MKVQEFFETMYWPEHVKTTNRPGTARNKEAAFRLYILPMFGDRELVDIKAFDYVRFRNAIKAKGLSDKTLKNHQSDLRHMLNMATEWEVIPHFPKLKSVKVELPKMRVLSSSEFKALKASVAYEKPRFRALFYFAARTGMRIGELRGLKWSDFETLKGRHGINVARSVSGRGDVIGPTKNGKARWAPIDLSEVLRHTLGGLDPRTEFLFSDPKRPTVPLTYKAADCAIKRMMRRARLDAIGWHTIRHTFASALCGRGVNVVQVKDLLGHVDIRTTMRYVQLDAACLSDAARAIEDF